MIERIPAAEVDPIDYAPQTGGTIEGFASVSHDGQAQYLIPLTVPPGRAGLEPRLTLGYDSTAGSENALVGGFMGPGWRLGGLSSISFCPRTVAQDGFAEGVRIDGTQNAYCLDGQRLIVVDGEEGALDSAYRTEIDTGVRIQVDSVTDSLPRHFKVFRKDGRIETYSSNDPGGTPFVWLLSRVEDRLGNYMTVEYDQGRQSRKIADQDSFEIVPVRIAYAGHDDRAPDTILDFHYVNRTDVSGSVMPDVRTRFHGGLLLRQTKFLTKISASISGYLAREYQLHYDWMRNLQDSRLFLLDHLRECAPFLEDPSVVVCKPQTEFVYDGSDPEPTSPGLAPSNRIGFHPNDPRYALFDVIPDMVLDFDGDGADDLLMAIHNSPPESGGNPFGWNKHFDVLLGGRTLVNTGVADDIYNAPERYNVLDFDNDGADDVLMEKFSEPGSYKVLTYKDGAFQVVDTHINSSWDNLGFDGVGRTYIVDADGDGVRDILRCHGKIEGPYSWTLIHVPDLTERTIEFNHFCYAHYLAMDTDGSGSQQQLLIQHMPEGSTASSDVARYIAVEFQNAEGTASGNVTVATTDTEVETRARNGITGQPLDVNGDGLLDILVAKNGQLDTYLATGNRSRPYIKSPASLVLNSENTAQSTRLLTASGDAYGIGPVLDVNGDGRDDVIVSVPGAEFSKVIYATAAQNGPADAVAFAGWKLGPLLYPTTSWGTVPNAPDSAGGGSITEYVGRSQAMDLNGDGVKDFVQKEQHSLAPGDFFVNMRTGLDAPKLTRVTNGLGAEVEFEYTPLSSVTPPDPSDPLIAFFPPSAGGGKQVGEDCVFPRRCMARRQTGVRVQRVSQGSRVTSDAARVRTFRHEYGGGAVGLNGRGWLGYAHHTIYDTDQKISDPLLESFERFEFDTVTFDPDSALFPFLGIPIGYVQTTVITNDQAPLQVVTRTSVPDIRRTTANPRVVMPFIHQVDETEELQSSLSPSAVSTLSHTRDIDDFGNVKHLEWTWNGGTETDTVDITYKHEEDSGFSDDWLIALPRRVVEFSSGVLGESVQTNITRTTEHDYYLETGLRSSTTLEPGGGAFEVTTQFFPDEFGNLRTMEARAGDVVRSTGIDYDARDVFPRSIIDAEEYLTEYEFDDATGVAFRTTENGSDSGSVALETLTVPDRFGRIRFLRRPEGRETTIDYAGRNVNSTSPGFGLIRAAFDELGRETSRQTPALDGQQLFADIRYDQFGRVGSIRRPGLVLMGGSGLTTDFSYDNLDRPLLEEAPDGTVRESCYDGLVTCTKDARGFVRCQELDAKRRVIFSADPVADPGLACADAAASLRSSRSGFSGLSYRHGPFDGVEAITDSAGNSTEILYDRLGRPERRSVPGGGVTTYSYTPFGDLDTVTEAVGTDSERAISFVYDLIGRRRFRREGADETEWVWRTDLPNRLDHSTSPDGVTLTQDYDDRGRVHSVSRSVDDTELTMVVEEYDAVGRPKVISYPTVDDPFQIENVYDENSGTLREVRSGPAVDPSVSYWTLEELSRLGQIHLESFGNELVTERTYYADTGFVESIKTGPRDTTPNVQRRSYVQDGSGNIEGSTDEVSDRADVFAYDEFDRLDTVTRNGDLIQDYAYGELGGLETNGNGWSYDYVPANPYSVRTLTDGTEESTFNYDDFGQLRQRTAGVLPELNARYTSFHKPSRIWGTDEADAVIFRYDSEQSRVVKTSGTERTDYFDKLYSRTTDSVGGSTKEQFIVSNGIRPVAEVIRRSGEAEETFYLHDDLLGSIDVVSDEDGDVAERRSYDPFGGGGVEDDTEFTDLGFTTHRHEAALGLIDMGGRIYDPRVGQFLEPDPLAVLAQNTQQLNPYAYALNNPLRFTDPSGFMPCDNNGGCRGGVDIGPFNIGGSFSVVPAGQGINDVAPFLPGFSDMSSFGAFAQRGPGPSRPTPAASKSISEAGLQFIAALEHFVPFPKDDGYGNVTVGYGYVPRPGEDFSGGITRAQAEVLLRQKMRVHEDAVRKAITRPLTQRQFDALVSFSYNAGTGGFTESGVVAAVNAGKFDDAATAMFTRVKAGRPAVVSLGIVHRRVLEAELMLRGEYGRRNSESIEVANAAYSALTEGRKVIYR